MFLAIINDTYAKLKKSEEDKSELAKFVDTGMHNIKKKIKEKTARYKTPKCLKKFKCPKIFKCKKSAKEQFNEESKLPIKNNNIRKFLKKYCIWVYIFYLWVECEKKYLNYFF